MDKLYELAQQRIYDRCENLCHDFARVSDTGTIENLMLFYRLSVSDIADDDFTDEEFEDSISWLN